MVKNFKTEKDFNHFLLTEKKEMHEIIVNSIEFSFYMKEEYAAVLEAVVEDKNNSFMIGVTREQWIPSLQKALDYFETSEEYEMCEIVFSLIKEIREDEQDFFK